MSETNSFSFGRTFGLVLVWALLAGCTPGASEPAETGALDVLYARRYITPGGCIVELIGIRHSGHVAVSPNCNVAR